MTDFIFIPGESFNGAVARWADEADFERMIDVTSHAGVVYGHRQYVPYATPEQIAALAHVMSCEADELLVRATPRTEQDPSSRYDRHLFHGVAIPSYLIEKHSRRYAPRGLVKSLADKHIGHAYDRAVWHIRAFPFCTESWQTLRDTCPECGKRPAWRQTLGIDRCEHCMADLKTAHAGVVPKVLRPSLTAAAGLVDHDPGRRSASLALLPERISKAGPSVALDLLVNLLPVVDPTLATDPVLLFAAPTLQICGAVAAAWRVMVGWPDAMGALTSARIATRTDRHNDGNAGRTIRFLSPKRNTGVSSELQALIAEWRVDVDLDGPNGDAILKRTRSITDVAQSSSIGSQELSDLRHRNAFPTVFVLDHGRPEPRFPVEVFQTIVNLGRVRMSMAAARLAIGVSCQGIEQLVAMRLLDQEDHPFVLARYGTMQIVASSIDRLERQLAAGAHGDPEICTLPLYSAMKAVGGRLKPWGPVFAALVDGSIPPGTKLNYALASHSGPLSRRILIDPSDLRRVCQMAFEARDRSFRQISYSETMSKIDATEVLNLGFSKSVPLLGAIRTAPGTHEKLVPVAYVLDLARTHISAGELAARRGVSRQYALRDARRAGVPNLGPGGFCRREGEKHLLALAADAIGAGFNQRSGK